MLVQLGQGDEVRDGVRALSASTSPGRDGVRVAALRSHLAAMDDTPPGVVGLDSTYPMSRYLRAFDATVSAAGYNAYHELIRFGVPSLFVPMRRQTDDQEARARYAETAAWAWAWTGPPRPGSRRSSTSCSTPRGARRCGARLPSSGPENGAAPAAEWLAGLAGDRAGPKARDEALEALRRASRGVGPRRRALRGARARRARADRPPDRHPAQGAAWSSMRAT